MSATRSQHRIEILAVVDTNVFVPAIAGCELEARFYNGAIRKCWRVVFSEQIKDEYERVIHEYGYISTVIIHELNKLYEMNKYRFSLAEWEDVPEDLAPRKDRHIIAPCRAGHANVVVTHDRGIHQRKTKILEETGARVLSLSEAQAILDNE